MQAGPEDFSKRGAEAIHRGDYESAIRWFSEGIRAEPRNVQFYLDRALGYHLLRQNDKAIVDLTEALQIEPTRAGSHAYALRGNCHLDNKDVDRAIADFDEAIRLGIEKPLLRTMTYVNRGVAYDDRGEHDKAIADFTEALRLDPNCANAYHERGLACMQNGEQQEAILDFSEFIKRRPNDALGYANRALAYQLASDDVNAARDARQAQELGAKNPLDRLKEEWGRLRGMWKVRSGERTGTAVGPAELGVGQIVIVADRMTFRSSGLDRVQYQIGINPTARPKAMDWLNVNANVSLAAIYSVEGKKLQLCFPLVNSEDKKRAARPGSFETRGKPLVMIIAEREE